MADAPSNTSNLTKATIVALGLGALYALYLRRSRSSKVSQEKDVRKLQLVRYVSKHAAESSQPSVGAKVGNTVINLEDIAP